MLVFDTETSALLKPDVAELATQPHIIEIALIKLDQKYRAFDKFSALLNPGVPIDEAEHKRITGLKNADLADQPIFAEIYDALADFCLGERTIVAHNLAFDLNILVAELRRINKEFSFPYPPIGHCTVELTKHIKGHRLALPDLYELKLKKKLAQKHRAMSDAEALVEIVRAMKL